MKLSELLLPEFDREMASTRKVLERVPEDKLAWKPHPKSFSMAGLATHLASITGWGVVTLTADSFDLSGPDAKPPAPAASRQELLEMLDRGVASLRPVLAAVEDADLFKPWSLLMGGKAIFTLPRIVVYRTHILNHTVHHRAQLGVYLRLNDVPVPMTYGPTADES